MEKSNKKNIGLEDRIPNKKTSQAIEECEQYLQGKIKLPTSNTVKELIKSLEE